MCSDRATEDTCPRCLSIASGLRIHHSLCRGRQLGCASGRWGLTAMCVQTSRSRRCLCGVTVWNLLLRRRFLAGRHMERGRTVSAFGCWLEGLCQHSSPGLMSHRVQDTDQKARPRVLSRDDMLVELERMLYLLPGFRQNHLN